MTGTVRIRLWALAGLLILAPGLRGQDLGDVRARRPRAVVDLATAEGAALVGGTWRYHDARVIEVDHRDPGPDLKPTGAPNRAYDIEPRAGAADFDDSSWERLDPETLWQRRSHGRLAFNWYRIDLEVPALVGGFDPTGSDVVFEIVVDDYAEVWVNGQLPLSLGQSGGPLVRGWNAPNRVLLGRNVRPGQRFQIAVFGANGPLSAPPDNYIWIRSATLDFYDDASVGETSVVESAVHRLRPGIDRIVPDDAVVERVAGGFLFTEGPVWSPEGTLLFSDPNANQIYRWSPDGELVVYRTKSGYAGVDIAAYGQPGSNGLTLDAEGRLTVAEHGRRRVVRIEKNGLVTVLADRYEGRRLNSPNDLVYRSDGALYFTDPYFGLPAWKDDPAKELPYSGVFLWRDGVLTLLTDELDGPNGLAFSPDERFLYVGNWDVGRKVVMRYEVRPDGRLLNGMEFFSLDDAPGEEAIDGVKTDREGNLYVSGPGGVWIVSSNGEALGRIELPELPANFAWGDADARTLYMTARTSVYRIRLNVPGIRPASSGTLATR